LGESDTFIRGSRQIKEEGNWVQSKPRVEPAGSDCSRPPFLRLLRNRLHTIKPEQLQVADFIAQVSGTEGAAI